MTTKVGIKKTDERRLWFKHQLELRGSSFANVARQLGVSRQAVRKSILNPSPRVAEAVAAELGVECTKLWPDRYLARHGTGNSLSNRLKYNPVPVVPQ